LADEEKDVEVLVVEVEPTLSNNDALLPRNVWSPL